MRRPKNFKVQNYILLFFLMGISSMPILVGNIFLVLAFIYTFLVFFNRFEKIDKFLILYSLVFLFLFSGHVLVFESINFTVLIAFFLRIYYAYFTVKIIGSEIDLYYVNTIYFFSIISLPIWLILLINPDVQFFLLDNVAPFFNKLTYYQDNPHILIYTLSKIKEIIPRNSGPFWEPGGFGIFLTIALVFNLLRTKNLLEYKNIIFVLTIITTFSTGAYVTLFFVLISYLVYSRRLSYILFILPTILFIAGTYFEEIPFLSDKIKREIIASEGLYSLSARTRFVSAKLDFDDFLKNPIIGKGRFNIKTYDDPELFHRSDDYRSNGTSNVLAEFGAIGFIFYFLTMFFSFREYCFRREYQQKFSFLFVAIVMISGFSQVIFTKPFFFALSFMFLFNSDISSNNLIIKKKIE
jgi:hypothetical protein